MHTTTAPSQHTLTKALAAIAAAAPLGFAQSTPIEPPRWVTITETAQLRCAPGSIWYPVAVLEPGTTLRADATEDGWLRVNYPADTPALALARNAELNQDTRTVTITRRTGLRALNLNYPGVETSFKPLFSRDLPPVGTTLDYLATITNDQGQPVAFRVRAPQNARGFVLQASTRNATDAEIDAATQPDPAAPEDQNDPAQADQAPDETPSQADATPQQRDTTQNNQDAQPRETPTPRPDGPSEPTEEAEDREAPETDTQAEPDTEVPTQTMGQRSEDQTQPTTPNDQTEQTDDLEGTTPRQRLTRVFQRLEALDQRFNAVRNQPPGTTEAAPLIAEYRRLIAAARPTVVAEQVEQVADARITILEVRTELADALRDVDQAQERTLAADERLDRLARTTALPVAYAAVGRLVPSTVYDGQNGLPLRYRLQIQIQANTSTRTRTVAYIEPNETFDPETIATLLGLRVGIDGDMRTAAGTAVPIINPSRLEALEPAPNDG